MATRQMLLQRRRVPAAVAAAGATLTYLTLPQTRLMAEAPASPAALSRKPIYDDVPAQASAPTLSPAPSSPSPSPSSAASPTDRLAKQVGRVRTTLHALAAASEDSFNAGLTRALRLEHGMTTTVASLAPAPETHERLGPGLIYVLVAGMATSIATRNRSILLRGTAPPLVALGAAWTLLPYTMRNVSDLAWRYEERAPALADAHLRLNKAVQEGWRSTRATAKDVGQWTERTVRTSREVVEGWVSKGR